MKKSLIVLLCLCSILWAESINDIIDRSQKLTSEGNFDEAVSILQEGIKKYPESADLYAHYGMNLSKQAGEASFLKARMLSDKAFNQFDKALEIDSEHRLALLNRGILSINVPKFMGKLDQGIKDLESILSKYGENHDLSMAVCYYLGIGYQKKGNNEQAGKFFRDVVLYGKNTPYYMDAKKEYEKISEENIADSNTDNYSLALQYLEEENLSKAVEHFRLASKQQPDNLDLHLLYARALGEIVSEGYNESIEEDVTARAEIANEVFSVLSHCVDLSPDNEDILFLRGSVAVNLPFFVNSLNTGIADLEYLSQHSSSREMKSKSAYLLKEAKNMQIVYSLAEEGYWAETAAERQQLLPKFIKTQSPIQQTIPQGDYLQIDLTIGYRDQIQPQTAVWIEDIEGNYVATLYVSGFAGFVKDKQVHLPRWAKQSKFNNIEAVTGASIDCGKHRFYWNFKDFNNNNFDQTKFIVKAEICHWPHVQYTLQEISINLEESKNFKSYGDKYLLPEIQAKVVNRKIK